MDPLHNEEDQAEALRQWWQKYGKAVSVGVIAAILAAVGVQSWMADKHRRTEAASSEYSRLLQLLDTDKAQASGVAAGITTEYEDTTYAPLAALLAARLAADSGDWAKSAEQLQWAEAHSDDAGLRHIARLRLARVWLQMGKTDEALKLVEGVTHDSHAADYQEVMGDIYLSRGEQDQAREAYSQALAAASLDRDNRLLQMKLDDLATGNGAAAK